MQEAVLTSASGNSGKVDPTETVQEAVLTSVSGNSGKVDSTETVQEAALNSASQTPDSDSGNATFHGYDKDEVRQAEIKDMAKKETTLLDVIELLNEMRSDMSDIKDGQESMRVDISSIKQDHIELNRKISDFKDSLDFAHGEISDLKEESKKHETSITKLVSDSSTLGNQFNELNVRLRRTEAGVSALRNDTENLQDQIRVIDPTSTTSQKYPIERTVVVYNVPYRSEEIVFEVATEIVSGILGLELYIVRSKREGARYGKNGIVKIEFESEHDMKEVLKAKRILMNHDNPVVRRFFIRQSQSDEARRNTRNLGVLLKCYDPERTLRINAKGDLVENNRQYGQSNRGQWRENPHIRFESNGEESTELSSTRAERGGYSDSGRGQGMSRGRGTSWMSGSGRGSGGAHIAALPAVRVWGNTLVMKVNTGMGPLIVALVIILVIVLN